jgi:hypothetical protein
MNHCGRCYYFDQTSDRGWLRQCKMLKDNVLLTGDDRETCCHFKDLYQCDLFGESIFSDLVKRGLLLDFGSYIIDNRFK